jgi:SAM-dependent methyltransferase
MICKICSSITERIENIKKSIIYYKCKKCDFIFIDEESIYSPEKEELRYLKHNNTLSNPGYVEMFENFIEKYIVCYNNKIKSILDFGCGSVPVLAKLLKDRGFIVDIYDKYFFPEKEYLNKRYDLIVLSEVIEHLKNPLKELKHLKGFLNKDGKFIIMTLFHTGNKNEFLKWWYKEDFTHISFFSQKTFKYLTKLLNMKLLMIDNKKICILQKT